MQLQKLLGLTRKAVDEYRMIQPGDKIALGISGGKDSLTMLYALAGLRDFYPNPFTVEAVTVSMGYPEFDTEPVRALCGRLEVPYTVVETGIARVVFDERKESNPCSLCAKLRKGAFNRTALSLGCNKIAYAHHRDDLIETLLMSLILEGRIHTFSPVTHLDRTGLTLIRPLMYVNEADICGFRNKYQLPVIKNPCPADGHTQREYVKELIRRLDAEHPGVRKRLFTAIQNGNLPDFAPRYPDPRRSQKRQGESGIGILSTPPAREV